MSFELVTVKIEPEELDPSTDVREEVFNQEIKVEIELPPPEQGQNDGASNLNEGSDIDIGGIKQEVCNTDTYPVELLKVEFRNEDTVTNADDKNEVAGDYPCHLCGAAFQYLSHVTSHLHEHVRKTFPCPDCSREFIQASDLEAHRVYHNSTLYPCSKCGEKFISEALLEQHSEEHGSEGAYECTICHRKLKAKYSLKIHMTAMHLSNKPFSCEECPMKFPAQWRLRQHMKLHTGEGFPCTYCEKLFLSQAKLEVHVLSHTGEKPVECSMCNKRFKRNHNLKVHMRMHTGEKKFVCDIDSCVKAFYTKSDLTSHKAAVHSKDKPRPFKCSHCESAFTKNTQLRRHFMNCHSEETPYSCDACNLRFKSKTKWKYHMMQHSENKPFKCDICDAGFMVRYLLSAHMVQHSEGPYCCEICNKTFKSKYNVSRHVANVHKVDMPSGSGCISNSTDELIGAGTNGLNE